MAFHVTGAGVVYVSTVVLAIIAAPRMFSAQWFLFVELLVIIQLATL